MAKFKFLGSHITNDVKWHTNCDDIAKEAHQRLYFLRSLNSFHLQKTILVSFYRSTIESVLTRSITVWFGAACKKDIKRLSSVVRSAERIIGTSLPSLESIFNDRTQNRTAAILKEQSHPANYIFTFLRSGRRLRTFYGNKRFTNSFYPTAVRIYNSWFFIYIFFFLDTYLFT